MIKTDVFLRVFPNGAAAIDCCRVVAHFENGIKTSSSHSYIVRLNHVLAVSQD